MSKKRTQEEYVNILNELGNNEYDLLPGELYQQNKIKLKTLHKTCGRITSISPRDFINGQRCFECSKQERIQKKRDEKHREFVQFLEESTNGEYHLLEGEYFVNVKTPLNLVHTTCGDIYSVLPYEFRKGSRCPKCRTYKSKNHGDFVDEFNRISSGEYEVAEGEQYINSNTPIKIRHKKCGNEYHARPNNLLRGQGKCGHCKEESKKSIKCNPAKVTEFIEKVQVQVGDEYSVVDASNLINSKSRVTMRHEICGFEYGVVVNNFLQGSRCRACAVAARSNRPWKRKTHEEFAAQVEELTDGEYELLSNPRYINNSTYVMLKHKQCGFEYLVAPGNFTSGRRCPDCQNKARSKSIRKSHEDFVAELYKQVEEEYSVLSEYKNSNTKVRLIHNQCGHQWDIIPSSFLTGTRCPECMKQENAKKKSKGIEGFKEHVYSLVKDEYAVKEGEIYINNQTSLTMIHKECGYEYEVRPSNFLNGRRCPSCREKQRGEKTRKPIEVLIQEIEEQGQGDYSLTDNSIYINTDTPIEMKHHSCGYVWNVTPSSFLRGNRCPSCNGGIKRTHEQFLEELYEKGSGEYTVSNGEIYINNNTHITLHHNKCNTEFSSTPGNFFAGHMCPTCSQLSTSKGEKEINDFLEENNIEFIPQFTFADCKYKRSLRFDFAVFHDGQLRGLIEYNGQQHYYPINWFGGEEGFKETVKRDNIKRIYCKKHNIRLVEIRFDEDLLSVLVKELTLLGIHIDSKRKIAA